MKIPLISCVFSLKYQHKPELALLLAEFESVENI